MGGKSAGGACVVFVATAALFIGGCAVSIPIPGFSSEEDTLTTASIQPETQPRAHLASWVDAEDSETVLNALADALDPQGAGASVDWAHKGRRGAIRPTGRAEPAGDLICRPFLAEGTGSFGPYRASGTACRDKRGTWAIRDSVLRPRG